MKSDQPTPESRPAQPPARVLSPRFPLLLAGLFVGALWVLETCSPAEGGEPLSLRWARKAAEHRGRSGFAAFLLLLGIWPAEPQEGAEGGESSTDLDSGLGR